jgi:hypothetical protein
MNAAPAIFYIVLAHLPPEKLEPLLRRWQSFSGGHSRVLLCYGGRQEDFSRISFAEKVFVGDPRLRTRDHQREKQSYTRVFSKASRWLAVHPECRYVYVAEFDHWPLVQDLGKRLVKRLEQEQADVLGHQLYRRDGTSCCYYAYHIADERFLPWLASISRREDKGVVFNMFGSGSFWTREAFLAVAEVHEPFPMYLEMYLPTLAHHLGFRVRDFQEQNEFVSAEGDRFDEVEEAIRAGAWTLHPVKNPPGHEN